MAATLLISAFEPFGGSHHNASQQVMQWLSTREFGGYRLETVLLPVDTTAAPEMALTRLRTAPPEIFVMLGEAAGRTVVTPERVAINVDDYPIPDNAGIMVSEEPIVPGGPAAYFSGLDVKALVNAAIAAGYPGAVSNTAGTYLCNRLFYSVMHAVNTQGMPVRAGFIHVPTLEDAPVSRTGPALEAMLRRVVAKASGS